MCWVLSTARPLPVPSLGQATPPTPCGMPHHAHLTCLPASTCLLPLDFRPVAPEPCEKEGKPVVFFSRLEPLPGFPSLVGEIHPPPAVPEAPGVLGLPAFPVCRPSQRCSQPALSQPLGLPSAFSPQGLCTCCCQSTLLPLHNAWRLLCAQ